MIISKEEFLEKEEFYIDEIKSGKVFIYPTDTIYGIGCNATLDDSVKRIKEIKKRDNKPFSVIAPSKKWIKENCDILGKEEWLLKLPGPYTLIVKLKEKNCISSFVNDSKDSLGIRIPDNWFSKIVEKSGVPFVTTSANISGEKHMSSMDDLSEDIKTNVDYVIYEGVKMGSPSTIINLLNENVEIKERK